MYLDTLLEFSDSQAVTVTANSTNIVDLYSGSPQGQKNALRDVGTGDDLYLMVQVDTTFVGGTSITPSLQSATSADLLTSPVTHITLPTYTTAQLTAGITLASVRLPKDSYKRYLGVVWTAVGTYTAGALSAFVTTDQQSYRSYANNYTP